MDGLKKSSIPRQFSYKSQNANPINDLKHSRSCSSGGEGRAPLGVLLRRNATVVTGSEENLLTQAKATDTFVSADKENRAPCCDKQVLKPLKLDRPEVDLSFGSKMWESIGSEEKQSAHIWDHSDSEAAPASSWSTLANRTLLLRPLPLDVGKCTCVIVKEKPTDGAGGTLYSLYTNEGKGRQDRKLAVAHHRRRGGRSEFTVAQNTKGVTGGSSIGSLTANFMGSKYHIWEQGGRQNPIKEQSKLLLASVRFRPTIATWTGSYRKMKTCIPKCKSQSLQPKSTKQVQHINRLPRDWEERMEEVHQLVSRVPYYNNLSKQHELDYRDSGRAGLTIQTSVKNFQLTLEDGKQTILQLGRIGKSKFVMDYRHPLTGYQAFCICLASIDTKLCCTV